jgi:two-component system, chemotaxis family, sensor kinase CheA
MLEGIVHVDGKPVELLNTFHFFEMRGEAHVITNAKPLCFVDCDDDDGWERRILSPLLAASGYEVSFDAKDKAQASVVLARGQRAASMAGDGRVLQLRDAVHPQAEQRSSIYRYDRIALISAIEAKLAGAL